MPFWQSSQGFGPLQKVATLRDFLDQRERSNGCRAHCRCSNILGRERVPEQVSLAAANIHMTYIPSTWSAHRRPHSVPLKYKCGAPTPVLSCSARRSATPEPVVVSASS